jgi:hypothetical protein
MSAKGIIAKGAIIICVLVIGYFVAAFQFRQQLSTYEKRISAIARSRNSTALFKEIELLVILHKDYVKDDPKVQDILCKLITLKVKQMSEDRKVISEWLHDGNKQQNADFAEGTTVLSNLHNRELEVAIDAVKQIGCN